MKEEIKEILDKLKDENNYQVDCNDGSAFKELFANEINLLLDYITNLQEENQELKKQLEHYKTQEVERIDKNLLDAKNNYLERCIKANMVGGNNE